MARIPYTTAAFLALLAAMQPASILGQTVPSSYRFMEDRQEASLFVGFANPGTGRFGYGPASGLIVGGRYGLLLGGPFALEGVVALQPTTRDIIDPSREEGNQVVGEADTQILTMDARLRFSLTGDRTWRGIHPYIFAGLGVGRDLAGQSSEDALLLPEDQFKYGTKFQAPFGGGIRWIVSDRFLIRSDLTVLLYRLTTPPGFLDPERGFDGVGEKEWVSGPSFSLGIGYHF
jgi:hypothetical protein